MQCNISPDIFSFISSAEGSNCFLLRGSKRAALIDSSAVGNASALQRFLQGQKVSPSAIGLVLHTHGHADHIGCDALFPKAKIAMHELDAEKINERDADFACTHFFPGTPLPKVSMLLKDNQIIDLGGLQLKVLHSPGHTAGSICFLVEKDSLLFSGDTLFAGGIGRTDFPTGSEADLVASLKKLLKISFKTLLPGHGPVLQGIEQNRQNIFSLLGDI